MSPMQLRSVENRQNQMRQSIHSLLKIPKQTQENLRLKMLLAVEMLRQRISSRGRAQVM